MKKALVAHIHDEPAKEQAYYPGKSSLPRLSYKKSMKSWFTNSGQVYQVSTCSSIEFQDLVKCCIHTAKSKKVNQLGTGDLRRLDYSQLLDRWYCLDSLLAVGAHVELFASEAEANHAILSKKESEDVRT